jgi:Fe-S cluster assembly protein SufD
MNIQPKLSDIGLSSAAQHRDAFLSHLLTLATRSQPYSPWLHQLRSRAAVVVQEQWFPTTRSEEWRFTDLQELTQLTFAAPDLAIDPPEITGLTLPEAQTQLVFVNGVYVPERSQVANLPPGVAITPAGQLPRVGNLAQFEPDRLAAYLGKQPGAEELFTALNTAELAEAAVVFIPKNCVVEAPIHLLFVSTSAVPVLSQPRCLVVAEANSRVTIAEEYAGLGEGVSFTNAVTEVWLADNAEVNHTRVQRDSHTAFHIGKTAVSQARDSRYTCTAISLGAKLSRHNLEIYQTGEQTQTVLNGLTMIAGEQLSDTHSAIVLTKPHGTTRQLHKCIVDDRAHAVFNGKVFVPQAAQMTDAGQLNRNLLLSPRARVDTKPQLEIVADNVKCTHGAAVGQLDADEVFYLQSRGIDAVSARRLLISAFAYDILDRIPIASLRQSLTSNPYLS